MILYKVFHIGIGLLIWRSIRLFRNLAFGNTSAAFMVIQMINTKSKVVNLPIGKYLLWIQSCYRRNNHCSPEELPKIKWLMTFNLAALMAMVIKERPITLMMLQESLGIRDVLPMLISVSIRLRPIWPSALHQVKVMENGPTAWIVKWMACTSCLISTWVPSMTRMSPMLLS